MSKEEISEDFFDGLQPLNNHFDDAFENEPEEGLLIEELSHINNRYEQGGEIGRGGMKLISSTTDKMTLRQVARASLKEEDPHHEDRFVKEARLTASLEHPNIIPVYDLGLEKGEPFFTMKLVEGENLSDLIRKMKNEGLKVPLQELMQIFLKICDAVAFAHSKKVIHLDLKPANIRLGQFGEVIVCDWGLAKIIGEVEDEIDTLSLDPNLYNDMTLDGIVKGSPGYLAPEQVSKDFGSKDELTDIYSLGGILYSLLTYRSPTHAKDLDKCLKQTIAGNISNPLEYNSKLPHSLIAVAMKALGTEKKSRYASVTELRRDINRWLSGFATAAEDAGFLKAVWLLLKRHKAVCGLLFFIVLLSAVLTVKIIVNEKAALEARALYLHEKEQSKQQAVEDVPRLLELVKQGYRDYDFDRALEYAALAVKKNPASTSAWSMKGRVHLMRQEFNAASQAFSHLEAGEQRRLRELAEDYGKLKKDDEFLSVELLKEFLIRLAHIQYSYLICGYVDNKSPDLNYRLQVGLVFMQEIVNRHIVNWDFDYEIKDGYVEFDFSRMQNLYSLAGIRNLPVRKLNIANTAVSQTIDVLKMPLEEIDISNSLILDPRPIVKIASLKRIKIHNTQYRKMNFPDRVEVIRIE
ncbi:MAG: protein kinase [Lentisphaerales bacterium]|nr:protein kinase [Lentisphaerales bacterium]